MKPLFYTVFSLCTMVAANAQEKQEPFPVTALSGTSSSELSPTSLQQAEVAGALTNGLVSYNRAEKVTLELSSDVIEQYRRIRAAAKIVGFATFFINDREAMNLKGRVKAVAGSTYTSNSNWQVVETISTDAERFEFNSQGYFLKKDEEFTDCSPCLYTYSNGKRTTIKEGDDLYRLQYELSNGLLIEKQYEADEDNTDDFSEMEFYALKTYRLNDKGQILEETDYFDDEMKEPFTRTKYEYDAAGHRISQAIQSYDDDLSKWLTDRKALYSDFDENGNPRMETRTDERGSIVTKLTTTYIYDSQKNWTEKRITVVNMDEQGKWVTSHYLFRHQLTYF